VRFRWNRTNALAEPSVLQCALAECPRFLSGIARSAVQAILDSAVRDDLAGAAWPERGCGDQVSAATPQ